MILRHASITDQPVCKVPPLPKGVLGQPRVQPKEGAETSRGRVPGTDPQVSNISKYMYSTELNQNMNWLSAVWFSASSWRRPRCTRPTTGRWASTSCTSSYWSPPPSSSTVGSTLSEWSQVRSVPVCDSEQVATPTRKMDYKGHHGNYDIFPAWAQHTHTKR